MGAASQTQRTALQSTAPVKTLNRTDGGPRKESSGGMTAAGKVLVSGGTELSLSVLNDAKILGKGSKREDFENAFLEMERKEWGKIVTGKGVKGGKAPMTFHINEKLVEEADTDPEKRKCLYDNGVSLQCLHEALKKPNRLARKRPLAAEASITDPEGKRIFPPTPSTSHDTV